MSEHLPYLFQPLKLRHKTLRNRLTFGPHLANMSHEGLPGPRHLGYYAERARGGVGLIVMEGQSVEAHGALTRGRFKASDEIVPGLAAIADAVHEHGAVVVQQLNHSGQHADGDNSWLPNWSVSGLPSLKDGSGSHAMNEAEIETVLAHYVAAALRAKKAGLDGIDVLAAYNTLPDQFWSPLTNRRDDRWGGSLENRCRFTRTLLTAIRQACGEDFIIGLSVSGDDLSEKGLPLEEVKRIVAWHDVRHLMDYVSVGTGSFYDFSQIIPAFMYDQMKGPPLAAEIRSVVRNAVVQAESHVRTPENADKVIADGMADMVSIVRGQIADPHLANKAREGRAEDVRPCISCNQLCWGRRARDYWVSCLVNPSAGREWEWGGDRFEPSGEPKRVLVVGGGPGGMEAARVAAERGHRVTLVESSDHLGGQFALAARQPRREALDELIAWFDTQLTKQQVEVRLNTAMTADEVSSGDWEEVIVATGSEPARDGYQRALPFQERLPGVEADNVVAIDDVLAGDTNCGKRVLVLDDLGNWKGAGTALYLAERDHDVTIATRHPMIAPELVNSAATAPLVRRMAELKIKPLVDTVMLSWEGNVAALKSTLDGGLVTREFDTLVLATTNRPVRSLHDSLMGDENLSVHMIGDSLGARRASAAIYEGRKLALEI
ncbi:MAG: NAD-binding protein [Alphaproteobacteria bacterium]|jgi:2,4-dienoyl-CoA reductase-like NADH-dependent reductase (Old Yellow Enzyme family)/thioredoxin reductase|nr:NAD-binding protein [Rhodospirillaceae bacterium]MDG2483247.1 NAD-binding protein [Alphaproteobacteria bacterium]